MYKLLVLAALIACAAAKPGVVAPLAAAPFAYANAPLYAAGGGSSQVDVRHNFDGTQSSYTTAPFDFNAPHYSSRYVSGIPAAPAFAAASPYVAAPFASPYAAPYSFGGHLAAPYAAPYVAAPFAAPLGFAPHAAPLAFAAPSKFGFAAPVAAPLHAPLAAPLHAHLAGPVHAPLAAPLHAHKFAPAPYFF
ncbi:skin secretory protein xP2-like [Drosophila busckii]|uniref:skin secretory protein xP2-like n=1 Tax=Drosophila busckii TaxID=30019 RepID=UPI00083EDD18|nr:skin secretory protein xP2-like [Drosophila busckii]